MKFSILVPVYNVAPYLKQCIESVLSQSYKDYELILTNDGSTDESPEICKAYAEKDDRIVYFNKQNEGLLLTRRFAIHHARGEYILFLDSDDYWESNLLSVVSLELEKNPVDMLLYRFKRVRDDGTVFCVDNGVFEDRTYFDKDNKEIFIKRFVQDSRLNHMWTKCVKREIIDVDTDYSAYKDKYGEDLLQSIALIRNANSILYLDAVLTNYRLSLTGSGRNFRTKYIEDYEYIRGYVHNSLLEMQVSEDVMQSFYVRYITGMVSLLSSQAMVSRYPNYERIINDVASYQTYKLAIKHLSLNSFTKRRDIFYFRLMRDRRYYVMYVVEHIKGSMKCIFKKMRTWKNEIIRQD